MKDIDKIKKEPMLTYEQLLMDTEFIKQRLDAAERKITEQTQIMNQLNEELVCRMNKKNFGKRKPTLAEPSEISMIYDMLKQARELGLEAEVVMFALIAMRHNPTLTLIEAMERGMEEWIK